jgi:chorismate-pyruvate lyase
MTEIPGSVTQSIKLAYPLDTFYLPAGRALPRIERVSGHDMPQPYRELLVGEHDMTPTLEAFYQHTLGIQVIERRVSGNQYARLVVLNLPGGKPVEFGAIVIYLDCLPYIGRDAVLEGRAPLGTVLAQYSVAHSSCPQAFVRVEPDALMHDALKLNDDRALYGRRNVLLTGDHRVLADILEILPPSSLRD